MKKTWFFLFLLVVLGFNGQSQREPSWITKHPKAQNNTYMYVVERAEGTDYSSAYTQAIGKVMLSAANRLGLPFDSKAVNAAIQNGESFSVISRQYNIPFNKVCEYGHKEGGAVVVYVLCQVAVSGNVIPRWDEFRKCESCGDLTTDNTSINWDDIKSNTAYFICGEGKGENLKAADDQALFDLASKFSDVIAHDEQVGALADKEAVTELRKKMVSYLSSIRSYSDSMILSNEPNAHVGRYIRRTDLSKIFRDRKRRVEEYLTLAMNAENDLRLDDALRYYNWAYTLLKTMRFSNDLEYTDNRGDKHLLYTWIPARMNEIFDGIRTEVVGRDGSDVVLQFTYKGKPVTKLDYTYFDGRGWSAIYSASDGHGVLELTPGLEIDHPKIQFEYMYTGQASLLDKEVADMMDVVKKPPFSKSIMVLSLANVENNKKSSVKKNTTNNDVSSTSLIDSKSQETLPQVNDDMSEKAAQVIDKVVEAIKNKKYSSVKNYFTIEGWGMFDTLMHYGNAKVLEYKGCEFSRMGGSIIARSVPMSFSFAKGVRKSFVENVVFTLNEDYKVECVAFGLNSVAMEDILSSKRPYSETARQTIINFLENYKTAYSLKRLDYINTIFDDNAVIIVGHVAYKIARESPESNKYINNKYVRLTQRTKEEYMEKLKRCFASQEFINIRFSDNVLTKAGGNSGETYGIQIKQDYYSTTYGDSGYLYLQVDLNDPDRPVIKVRTWQENFDPELNRPYFMWDF